MGSILRITKKEFTKKVHDKINSKQCERFIEAILDVCEDMEIEPGSVKPLLDQVIKSRISAEAQELNLIPKSTKIPLGD